MNLPMHFSDDPSIFLRRVDPATSSITLVTMHASKGLEFPYVFALGCASRTPLTELDVAEERDSEKMRLLYVALTRAKRRCYLPILLEMSGKSPDLGRASPIELMASSFEQKGAPEDWHQRLYDIKSLFRCKNSTHLV